MEVRISYWSDNMQEGVVLNNDRSDYLKGVIARDAHSSKGVAPSWVGVGEDPAGMTTEALRQELIASGTPESKITDKERPKLLDEVYGRRAAVRLFITG